MQNLLMSAVLYTVLAMGGPPGSGGAGDDRRDQSTPRPQSQQTGYGQRSEPKPPAAAPVRENRGKPASPSRGGHPTQTPGLAGK